MFFFKKKKILEMDEKMNRLLALLEEQSQTIQSMEKEINFLSMEKREITERINDVSEQITRLDTDNKQHLCDVLDERMEYIVSENENRLNFLGDILKKMENMISVSAKDSMEEIKDFQNIYEQGHRDMENLLDVIKSYMADDIQIGKFANDKLGVLENRVEEQSQIARNLEKALEIIKRNMDEDIKLGNVTGDKLDLIENEVRMLLINSVMGQVPDE